MDASMHEKIYMDMDNLMPKKRKDLFVNESIVTSRKRLKCNQMIYDYMQLIVVSTKIGYIYNWKLYHTFFGQIYDYVGTIYRFFILPMG